MNPFVEFLEILIEFFIDDPINHFMEYNPGTHSLCYSDAGHNQPYIFTEARSIVTPDEFFEYAGLNDIFMTIRHHPNEESIQRLYCSLIAFKGSETFDDVCMICFDII